MQARLLVLLLLVPMIASAETAPQPQDMTPRLGVTATAGGAAIPDTGLSVGVATLGLNIARGRFDNRISALYYSATGEDRDSTGVGLTLEQRVHLGPRYAIGFGSLISSHTIEGKDATLGLGVLATPATFSLGEARRWELGLTAFIVREFLYDTITPGFYFSLGYCAR